MCKKSYTHAYVHACIHTSVYIHIHPPYTSIQTYIHACILHTTFFHRRKYTVFHPTPANAGPRPLAGRAPCPVPHALPPPLQPAAKESKAGQSQTTTPLAARQGSTSLSSLAARLSLKLLLQCHGPERHLSEMSRESRRTLMARVLTWGLPVGARRKGRETLTRNCTAFWR